MKTLYNSLKIAAGVLIMSALAVSCLPEQQSIGDAGQTLVKLNPSEFTLVPFDAKSASQTGVLFEVRRDVHSQAALNSTTSVVLTYDTNGALLAAYNAENGTNFIPLPTNLGTTTPAVSGSTVTLDFAPGEFAKSILVTVPNATNFDFTKQYALAYTLTSVSGTGTISENSGTTIVAQVLVKNKYDGKYKATGYFTHPSSPRAIDMDKPMGTGGSNVITGGYADLGGSGYKYVITIDESSNLTVPGVTQRCYRVTMANLPTGAGFIYYNTTDDGTMKNYCYEHKPGKWTFVLFSGYSTGTRKAEETLVMY
jgi:hypothetical protein